MVTKKQVGNALVPPRGNISGALIPEEEARRLSRQLFPLGDQWEQLCEDLDAAGYGAPAAAVRRALNELAGTDERRAQLQAYWAEWAKERIAGLVGPINILLGKLPQVSAYRSDLLTRLRADVAAGKLRSDGPIVSPQIEPTLKRLLETLPDDPLAQRIWNDVKQARQRAAAALHLPERPEFRELGSDARYELLIERYQANLAPAGFTLDSHRKTGLIFRKLTSDRRWAFLFVDESRDDVDGGTLSVRFALTLPKKAVLPSAVSLNAVATFAPDDLVPRFRSSCGFARDSYAQFCLAADSIAFLTRAVYSRLNALLDTGDGNAI